MLVLENLPSWMTTLINTAHDYHHCVAVHVEVTWSWFPWGEWFNLTINFKFSHKPNKITFDLVPHILMPSHLPRGIS